MGSLVRLASMSANRTEYFLEWFSGCLLVIGAKAAD